MKMIECAIMGLVIGICCGRFTVLSGQKIKYGLIKAMLITSAIFIMWIL